MSSSPSVSRSTAGPKARPPVWLCSRTNWLPEPSLTIRRSAPVPVRTVKRSFGLEAEKSPLVSSIVVS